MIKIKTNKSRITENLIKLNVNIKYLSTKKPSGKNCQC